MAGFKHWAGVAALVAGLGLAQAARAQEGEYEVPYVPTPEPVVAEMLKLAQLTKKDVVYDLGSGDGRVVITAAQKYGVRGVGIDINPERIREARENARKAGVADRVTFREGDLFQADIHEATVVTMYLLPSVNLRLKPKLLADLKPGTRLISHDFDMGDWKPDKQVKVDYHTIYYWVVPHHAAEKK
jgi:ubiquinone/menaquinone biosynthesis C-methylase UbiE